MNILNNVADLNYQNWKLSINQFLLYNHFREIVKEENAKLTSQMKTYEESKEHTEEESKNYMELLNQLVFNSSSLYQKVEDNINNQELLNQIYEQKNIDVSEEGYKRWLETGEKIKI